MRRTALVLTLIGSFLAGCTPGSSDADAGRVNVVAAFYPLAEVAEAVGGDEVAVTNITPPGSEPHDVELSTRQVDNIEDADVILYLGGGFQPAVEQAARDREGAVDLVAGAEDPHVWLDPVMLVRIVDRIERALSAARPTARTRFETNATEYKESLEELDDDFEAGLANCRTRLVVTAHAAFGHLARRYDLTQLPISGISPEVEPDPKRLAELADEVRDNHVTTIFTERLVSPRVAEALAREAGVSTAVLDPIEGLSRDQVAAGENYALVMLRNLAALREALGCG